MIRKDRIQDIYPLSPMQEAMVVAGLRAPDSTAYTQQIRIALKGPLDRAAFDAAWQQLIDRHTILRTAFILRNTPRFLQIVLKQASAEVTAHDLSALDPRDREARTARLCLAERVRGFDLEAGPPSRIQLVRRSPQEHLMIWTHHHVLLDGWCLGLLAEEFSSLYASLCAGRPSGLAPARAYSNFIKWVQDRPVEKSLPYWKTYLDGHEPMPALPSGDAPHSGAGTADVERTLDPEVLRALEELASRLRLTPGALLHAAWGVFLAKYTDTSDALFTSVIANRPSDLPGADRMMGLLINAVPVRVRFGEVESFADTARQVHADMLARADHEHVPLAGIQGAAPQAARVFDTLLIVENYPLGGASEAEAASGLQAIPEALTEETHAPLTLQVSLAGSLHLHFSANPECHDRNMLTQFARHFADLLERLIAEAEGPLNEHHLLDSQEARALSQPPEDLPSPGSMAGLLAARSAEMPDAAALTAGGETLTYAELSRRADRLAAHLGSTLGVHRGDRVGLMLPRNSWLVTAMLALIRIGAAYVPLGPRDPAARTGFIVGDAGVSALIAANEASLPSGYEGPVLRLGAETVLPEAAFEGPVPLPDDLIYVAYTSGSTGQPKGVEIAHRSVSAFTESLPATLGLKSGERILGLTTHTFDISVLELISGLALGLEVVLADDDTAADPLAICDLIRERSIDVLQVTPSRLRTLVDAAGWESLEDVGTVLVGGEALPADLFNGLRALPKTRAINVYGPTETTIWSTAQDLSDGFLCVGRPFLGEGAFIRGRNGQIMPVGTVGELCLTGAGLGVGYHDRPELTAERYPGHPFAVSARYYRTGDLARRRADGRFEVLGRLDDQVKLRGHRIELGEIEAALRQLSSVDEAVVLAEHGPSGEVRSLTAYAVLRQGAEPETVLDQLAGRLPAYMIPSALIALPKLPLMASGKIDRTALRQMQGTAPAAKTGIDPPRDDTETGIARIFAEVLDRPAFGRTEDFFAAGGHSLLTARVIGRIRRDFGCSLSIREFFAEPTVAGLARHVRVRGGAQGTRIEPAPQAADDPLTPAQQQLFVLDRIRPGRADYVVSTAFSLHGSLDVPALRRALDGVMQRHESLRTAFVIKDDGPRQVVQPPRPHAFDQGDAPDLASAQDAVAAFMARGFDLSEGYLSRVLLVRIDEEEHVLAFALHHIVGDAISLDVIARDLSRLYNSEKAMRADALKALPLQQRDIARWISGRSDGPEMSEAAAYWAETMKGPVPRLDLPLDRPRPANLSDAGEIVSSGLDPDLSLALQQRAQAAGISLFSFVAAITAFTLTRWSGQDEVVVGTAVAGRDLVELESQIGLYVNMVPLRFSVAGHKSTDSFLSAAHAVVLGALEHQHYPYDRLIDSLPIQHDPARTPLVEVMVGLQRLTRSRAEFDGLTVNALPHAGRSARFDLTFDVVEREEGCFNLELSYRKSVVPAARAERLARSWCHVARQMVETAAIPLDHLAILPQVSAEEPEVIAPDTLTDMFARQVARTPEATALVEAGRSLTYRSLADKVQTLARALVSSHGAAPGDRVGLFLSRSADAVIALLAIQHAGAAYVPLDPKLPDARLRQIAEQAGIALVVTGEEEETRAKAFLTARVATVADRTDATAALPSVGPDDLAYVLFTSGTTGAPKGVMIEHGSVANLIRWMNGTIHGGRDAVPGHHAALASLAFDVSVHEIYAALLFGHTLHIIPDEIKTDPRGLSAQIAGDGITSLSLTPSLLSILLDAGQIDSAWPVRTLLLGAEELPIPMVEAVRKAAQQTDLRIFNLYGPSEVCVEATWHEFEADLTRESAAPIGMPIDGAEVLICDANLRALPPGIVGQICIGGPGLARGYLNAPELTDAAFVPHPQRPGARLYLTGDFGYRREDGVLMFCGRRDQQVKIRGYRIELLEIERQLTALPDIRSAVVTAPEGPAGRELVAYVVAGTLDAEAVRQALAEVLPAYMVPERYVRLDKIPLNASGKLDRSRLPAPGEPVAAGTPPRPGRETEIAVLWTRILGMERVTREDDFFRCGGHSLAAIRLLTALERETGVTVPLADFLRRPTVAGLAALSLEAGTADEIRPAPPAADYPLSPAQRRLWVLNEIDPKAYLLNVAVRIEGPLDPDRLAQACAQVGARHSALGTRFVTAGGAPRQIPAACETGLSQHDARGWSESRLQDALRQAAQTPFDLETGPPLRLQLWRSADERALFLLSLHHIVGDAGSLDLVLNEICVVYDALGTGETSPLQPLALQAHDIAVHENGLLARLEAGEKSPLSAARDYWHQQLAGGPIRLDLPSDRPRPKVKTSAGRTIPFTVDRALAKALTDRAASAQGGLFPLLTALVKTLFHRYTGEEDIWLGAAITARQGVERAAQVGFQVQTVVLRDQVSGNMPFAALVDAVAETIVQATTHAAYPLDNLIAELNVPRDTSRAGLFDAMIVYHVSEAQPDGMKDLSFTPVPLADDIARFDLTVHFSRDGDCLSGAIEFNTGLFDADRVTRLIEHLLQLARSVVEAGDRSVSALDMIPPPERALLSAFSTGPAAPMPTGTIHDAVWVQVARTPDRVAVAGSEPLTYARLKSDAQDLAAWLVDTGKLVRGEAVGVCMERGSDLVTAILAVMEAGGVYLPLDPAHPETRMDKALSEAGCRFVLYDAAGQGVSSVAPPVARYKNLILGGRATGAPGLHPESAYLIFTSGSTGRPKGVRVGHAAFLNMVAAQVETFGIVPEDRVLLFASPAFDASLAELFTCLTSGAALVPATAERIRDGAEFASWMTRERISVATLPPAYLAALDQPELPHLRVLITAGEAPLIRDVAHYAGRLDYFNAYGPTENAVCSTIQRVKSAGSIIPIGRPIANTQAHILGADLRPVPIGIPGEICVAGAGLALGYLDPGQTAARFVTGPDGNRLYRTGDRGTWAAEGTILYAGRDDAQVKIRGQRIELGEITAILEQHPRVQQALVLLRGEALLAYVVGTGQERELRRYAAAELPSAMVPARIVVLDAWPLTSSGKIDRARLPEPASQSPREHAVPLPGLESEIAEIWMQVLGTGQIGRHDDIFDVGADSLKIVLLVNALKKRGFAVGVADLYLYRTVEMLAQHLRAPAPVTADRRAADDGPAPVTAIQSWFFSRFDGNLNHFNQSVTLRLDRDVSCNEIREALVSLAEKHPALRTRFRRIAGTWNQDREGQASDAVGPVEQHRVVSDAEANDIAEDIQRGLDICKGRLIGAARISHEVEGELLVLVIHHLAVDGYSWRLILRDLTDLMTGRQPAPHDGWTMGDLARAEQDLRAMPSLLRERAQWMRLLGSVSAPPWACAAPCRQDETREVTLTLSGETTGRMLRDAGPGGMESILLGALAAVLRTHLPVRDLLFLLEGHGRTPLVRAADLSDTVGWCTTMFPLALPAGAQDTPAAVAAAIFALPAGGAGFLRLLRDDPVLAERIRGAIVFNYLGEFGAPTTETGRQGPAVIGSHGTMTDPAASSLAPVDCLAVVQRGRLSVTLRANPEVIAPHLLQAMLDDMMQKAASRELQTIAHTAQPKPMRPYDVPPSDPPVLLNAGSGPDLFAMPPLLGYGSAFTQMATALRHIRLHAFDFIEAEDRLERYADAITAICGDSPIRVVGLSGGALLAFEVVKQLEAAGHRVADLVILDTPANLDPIVRSKKEVEAKIASDLAYFRDRMVSEDGSYGRAIRNAEAYEALVAKMRSFITYLDPLVTAGRIAANIHQVRSEQTWQTDAAFERWGELTSGCYRVRQGFGNHADMLDPTSGPANSEIVERILDEGKGGSAVLDTTLSAVSRKPD
ncbi:non-ribosomal peptide synthetase [Roseibium marinum]|uniref:Tyrocidine synthetase-2 n=1 Tax=Roseibium marinum TaxID=281252 RepID=A0A2S3USC2_9HYPH|nr:non-ribosomal peptide synthetase [Roseibium marinum]POF30627.1 tyrocidine synthetase-2 [Roseibium marinum]